MSKKYKKAEDPNLLEDPNAILEKINHVFSKKQNQNIAIGIISIIILAIGGYFGYDYYINEQNIEAQEEIFQAQFYFEKDSFDLALNGDGNNYGFLDIIDNYGWTKTANLANFYAGASYLKKKDFDSAIEHLKVFSSDDYLMQSRSYSLIGDAYLEQDDFEDAINYYKKACSYKPNKAFTPIYLKKLALAQELGGATQDAANTYQRIINSYPNSNAVHDAKKNKARLEVL